MRFSRTPKRRRKRIAILPTQSSVSTGASRVVPHAIAQRRTVEGAEAVIGIAIVSAISIVVPGQWGFLDWAPHPLWIIVLAISIRYAAPAGYIAGILATVSQVLLLWFRPEARFHAISEHDLVQPFLFVVVGMLVSYAVQGQRQRLADVEGQVEEADKNLRTVTGAYQTVRTAQLELEKQIVGQSASITTLYRIAKQLETLHLNELYPAILDLVERFLECQACAIYLADGEQFRLRAGIPESVFGRRSSVGLNDGLIGQAIREQRVVTIRDRLLQSGPALLSDEPALIAGPLIAANGKVRGVIVVERLPFLKFTPATVGLFSIILDWASTALANASLHEETRERLIDDEITGAYRAAHTMRLMHEHMQRSHRYHVPVSIIIAHINGFATTDPAIRAESARAVVTTLRQGLRSVDIIGHHPDPDRLILILPMTDRQNAEIACARMANDLSTAPMTVAGLNHRLDVRFAIVACSGAMTAPESVLAEASTFLAPRPTTDDGDQPSNSVPLMHLRVPDDVQIAAGDD